MTLDPADMMAAPVPGSFEGLASLHQKSKWFFSEPDSRDIRILMDIDQNGSMDRSLMLNVQDPPLPRLLPHVDPFLNTEPQEGFL